MIMIRGLLTTVKRFSDDVTMQFDLEKCTKISFSKASLEKSKIISLDINTESKNIIV